MTGNGTSLTSFLILSKGYPPWRNLPGLEVRISKEPAEKAPS
jgi:hypothetical protein